MRWPVIATLVACGASHGAQRDDPRARFADELIAVADLGDAGEIFGELWDAKNEPMIGLTVSAKRPDGKEDAAITDERGRWRLTDLPPGSYTLTYYFVNQQAEHRVEVRAGHVVVDRVTNWHPARAHTVIE